MQYPTVVATLTLQVKLEGYTEAQARRKLEDAVKHLRESGMIGMTEGESAPFEHQKLVDYSASVKTTTV